MISIFIIERDNPYNTPEPQVLMDGTEALRIVKEEYTATMEELGTSQAIADAGFGNHGCLWMFEENAVVGSALIDADYDLDKWYWRITEHEIKAA